MIESGRRAGGDQGAAILEFTLVAVLLLTLVFGIIQFGLILSFKQDMTRAAAEGARAGAVAVSVGGQSVEDAAVERARGGLNEAVLGFGGRFDDTTDPCGFTNPADKVTGLTCTVDPVASCADEPTLNCITVSLSYDYGSEPLYGQVPIIEAFLPETVSAESVARINE